MSWSTFADMCERLESTLGGHAALLELGEVALLDPEVARPRPVTGYFGSARSVYWAACSWYGRSLFRNLKSAYEEQDERELIVRLDECVLELSVGEPIRLEQREYSLLAAREVSGQRVESDVGIGTTFRVLLPHGDGAYRCRRNRRNQSAQPIAVIADDDVSKTMPSTSPKATRSVAQLS